jgi:hypothetical protein
VVLTLALGATSHGAIPYYKPKIRGNWLMHGVVTQSHSATPVGTTNRRTWSLNLSCTGGCHVRLAFALGKGRVRKMRLDEVGTAGNRYAGTLTGRALCPTSGGGRHYGSLGSLSERTSVRVTSSKLEQGSLVATSVVAYVTRHERCPTQSRSVVRRYQGTPAGSG